MKNIVFRPRALTIVLCMVLLCNMTAPCYAAEEMSPEPLIGVQYASAEQGQWVGLSVYVNNVENLSALDFMIKYDPSVLKVYDVYQDWLIYDKNVTISSNSDAESGLCRVTLLSTDGISGIGGFVSISAEILQSAAPGSYKLEIIVNDAFDQSGDIIEFKKQNAYLTVIESAMSSADIHLSSWTSYTNNKVGSEVSYYVSTNESMDISGGTLEIHYDETVLQFLDVQMSYEFREALIDTNYSVPGVIKISFMYPDGISLQYSQISARFKSVKSGNTAITLEPRQFFAADEDHSLINCAGTSANVIIEDFSSSEAVATIEAPDYIPSQQVFCVTVSLEENNGVAAADFDFIYDKYCFQCVSVENVSGLGDKLVIGSKTDDGSIRFSFMSENDICDRRELVKIYLKTNWDGTGTYYFSLNSSDVVNTAFERKTIFAEPARCSLYCLNGYNLYNGETVNYVYFNNMLVDAHVIWARYGFDGQMIDASEQSFNGDCCEIRIPNNSKASVIRFYFTDGDFRPFAEPYEKKLQ